MPKRISISLPDPYYEKLEQWAELDDRTVAGLASYILQRAIDDAEREGRIVINKEPPSTESK
ncbi:hypothetical protein C7B61_18380 [filamentous cyanobacterium CCP1]|nr:hypothetical protein C7B76_15285 [filamentous cyanobacterium CCP2]PSB59904.1 hypothetical protein C7B61_18380 [filamentous cyanobacterium CCP1]